MLPFNSLPDLIRTLPARQLSYLWIAIFSMLLIRGNSEC